MKILYLTLFLLGIAASSLSAQDKTTVFTAEGKLVKVPLTLKKGGAVNRSQIDTVLLEKWEKQQKEKMKDDLATAFSKTAAIIMEPKKDLSAFYEWLWKGQPGVENVAKYFKLRATQLRAEPFNFTPDPNFKELDFLLQTLFSSSNKLYKIDETKDDEHNYILKLKTIDLGNQFQIRLYNELAVNPQNIDFTLLKPETYFEIKKRLVKQMEQINESLELSRKPITDSSGVNQLYDSHNSFKNYAANEFLFKLLKKPWATSWLWKNNGAIRLNPLPFTDEDLLMDTVSINSIKSDYFKRYVTQSLEKRIKHDSIPNIESFIKDLSFVGKEKSISADSAAYKLVRSKNKLAAESTQLVTHTINEIRIPYYKADHEYLQYLDPEQNEFVYQDKIKPITTETNILTSIYNVLAKNKIDLIKTKEVGITDVSATQAGIDLALDGMSASNIFSQIFPDLKDIASVKSNAKVALRGNDSNFLDTKNYYYSKSTNKGFSKDYKLSFKNNAADRQGGTVSTSYINKRESLDSLRKYIETTISGHPVVAHNILAFAKATNPDNQILDSVWNANLLEIKSLIGSGLPALISKSNQIIIDYWNVFLKNKVVPPLVTVLKQDSTYLAQADIILKSSTLPPHIVSAKEDKTPQFKTVQRFIELDDSVKNFTYALKRYGAKDTVTFGKFSYKTGKIHFIQLSAGLAYTFDKVTTNTLEKTGSQINVTSSSQQYRFYAGVHIYPAGLFMLDGFVGGKKHWVGRLNIMAGVGIPKPIDNIYLGLGYDFGPAIRLSGGVHFHSYTRYQVSNDMVTAETKIYKTSFPFISLGINPASLVKALTLFGL